ncbi:MAG: oligosaccharide flippase family protein [Gammaproteobacteria bacterium]|nr:MAG: oligosaccharide flippase family protein [Gammaproteobacteria bacterium]
MLWNMIDSIYLTLKKYIEGRENVRKILANSSWLFVEKAIRLVVGLGVGILVARYLGVEQYGMLSYAIAIVALFSSISSLGLDVIVVKELVEKDSLSDIVDTAFVLKLSAGFVGYFFVLISIVLLKDLYDPTTVLVIIIALTIPFKSFEIIDLCFQAEMLSKYSVFVRSATYLIMALVRVFLVVMQSTLVMFAIVMTIESIIATIGMYWIFKKRGSSSLGLKNFNTSLAKELLMNGWPMALSAIFVLINMEVDKIMIGGLYGNFEVGYYAIATKLSQIWYFIPMVIGMSVFPTLISKRNSSVKLFKLKLQKIYSFLTLSAVIISTPFILFSDQIVITLFGDQYMSSGKMLAIHIMSLIFIFHISMRARVFLLEGLVKFIAIDYGMLVAINIILNLLLIPSYGGIGAAIASLLSWFVSAIFSPLFNSKASESVQMFLKSFTLNAITK